MRATAALQADSFESLPQDGFNLETGFDVANAKADALEADLETSFSPDFLALVASYFDDDDEFDDGRDSDEILDEDKSVTLTRGNSTVSIGDLVEGFPPILVPANSTLETSTSEQTEEGTLYSAVWQSNQDPSELLDFSRSPSRHSALRAKPNGSRWKGCTLSRWARTARPRSSSRNSIRAGTA